MLLGTIDALLFASNTLRNGGGGEGEGDDGNSGTTVVVIWCCCDGDQELRRCPLALEGNPTWSNGLFSTTAATAGVSLDGGSGGGAAAAVVVRDCFLFRTAADSLLLMMASVALGLASAGGERTALARLEAVPLVMD